MPRMMGDVCDGDRVSFPFPSPSAACPGWVSCNTRSLARQVGAGPTPIANKAQDCRGDSRKPKREWRDK